MNVTIVAAAYVDFIVGIYILKNILNSPSPSYTPDYGLIMIAVVIATLPTALIFFLMQKHFVAGMTGAVKG